MATARRLRSRRPRRSIRSPWIAETWPFYRIAPGWQPRSLSWRSRSRSPRAPALRRRMTSLSASIGPRRLRLPGQVVTFTAAADPPAGVDIKNYDWDLNGDGKIDKHGMTATWSYPAPGSVNVLLRVKGKGKHRGEAVRTVSVQAARRRRPPRSLPSHPSRSRRPCRSPISRCCSPPPPATPTERSPSRSGTSTATATTTTAAARRRCARSPMPANT